MGWRATRNALNQATDDTDVGPTAVLPGPERERVAEELDREFGGAEQDVGQRTGGEHFGDEVADGRWGVQVDRGPEATKEPEPPVVTTEEPAIEREEQDAQKRTAADLEEDGKLDEGAVQRSPQSERIRPGMTVP